jgi:hypothetical protein
MIRAGHANVWGYPLDVYERAVALENELSRGKR